jgi:thiamine biosynthesis lipoprotein
LLAELVQAGLVAAERTDGDVDPTIGGVLADLGYDRDIELLTTESADAGRRPMRLVVTPAPDWRQVRLDGDTLTIPWGVRLDLGATAKAFTADRCARRVAAACGVGVLVSLGGDIATAGPAPDGWRVLVQDRPGEPSCTISVTAGTALATSSTLSRLWRVDGRLLHHVLDPRTCQPARPVWRTASVVAGDCVTANTLSTAALVRGERAPAWLREVGVPTRLVGADATVVTLGGWP